MKRLIGAFRRYVRDNALLQRGDSVLAAVSGGPDSVALLRLLCIARDALGIRVCAAHANHGLRGADSDADEAFVKRLAARFGVPLQARKLRLRRIRSVSLEEQAREARYRFLLSAARKTGANKIATAHTRNDQAETVLMRLLRGSGLRGLAAIPAIREEAGIGIVRPLLALDKADLIRFLRAQRLPYRKDASNRDPAFFRNRIRRHLLPLIRRRYSAGFDRNLVDLGRMSAQVYDYLASQAGALAARAAVRRGRRMRVACAPLLQAHPAIRSEALFRLLEAAAGGRTGFRKVHLDAFGALLSSRAGTEIHLPRGLRARRTPDAIHLSTAS